MKALEFIQYLCIKLGLKEICEFRWVREGTDTVRVKIFYRDRVVDNWNWLAMAGRPLDAPRVFEFLVRNDEVFEVVENKNGKDNRGERVDAEDKQIP